jgi:predicted nucleic acid-binding protein
MILYLDSSAIVKQYVVETGSAEIQAAVAQSDSNGTSVISRAEVIATFQKTVRVGVLREEEAAKLRRTFDRGWPDLVRTRVTERLIRHASTLAWTHGLRGYDAVHLASAAAWQQALGRRVTVASFDKALWMAAREIALDAFPADLPALLVAAKGKVSIPS